MSKCPNCSYTLVLLEYRRKYKCPKCGKLFPQQEIAVSARVLGDHPANLPHQKILSRLLYAVHSYMVNPKVLKALQVLPSHTSL